MTDRDLLLDFAQRYMVDDRVIGVRIVEIDGHPTIEAEVPDRKAVDLPAMFHDLPVTVREGPRARFEGPELPPSQPSDFPGPLAQLLGEIDADGDGLAGDEARS
jgi:hypothetical protein